MSQNLVGKVILNQYRIDNFIAAGNMGAVYRVWDLKRNVPLAMKILHSDLADDPAMIKSFTREANALRKLSHPNIVPFYGVFHTNEFVFLLEAFIDGRSLKEMLKQRGKPLQINETLIILKSVCAALGYSHTNGVVHCDIKPGNVMIDSGGRVYLTDFGIARHSESTTTTLAGAGSPAYMAPEQIRNEPVTPATDIYALGITLFEILTGQRPFQGKEIISKTTGETTNERVRYAHLMLAPPDPRDLNSFITTETTQIILRALSKEPGDRYQNTNELYQAICASIGIGSNTVSDFLITGNPQVESRKVLEPAKHDTQKSKKKTFILSAGIFGVFLLIGFLWISNNSVTGEETSPPGQVIVEQPVTTTSQEPIQETNNISSNSNEQTKNISSDPTRSATTNQFIDSPPTPTLSPTKTPTTKPVVPTAPVFPTYFPLAKCPASRIRVGDWVYVSFGGGHNSIRSEPDTHPADNKIGRAETGEALEIINGPVCNYGWVLWEVRTLTNNPVVGWTPETNGEEFWLTPGLSWQACPSAPPSRLQVGWRAFVGFNPPEPNTVREIPGTSSPAVGKIYPGERIIIQDGPKCRDGYVWWNILSENSRLSGWTAEGKGNTYWLVPIPSP